jgi:hypothetical protein
MFLKKLGSIALDVRSMKFILLLFTRLENGEPWLKASAVMNEKKKAMVDRSILFKENSRRQLKSKL